MADHGWLVVLAVGFGGFGLGMGLVLGAFIARTLRRYMAGEHLNGHS